MLPCPNCRTKVGVKSMRTHSGKVVYRNYRCTACSLVFTTHETVVRNANLENQINDLYGNQAAAQLERMFGKPRFKYKPVRLKPSNH